MLPLILLLTPPATQLALTCYGTGAARKTEGSSIYGADSSGNSAWMSVQRDRSEPFGDQVDLRFDGENSRIRMPRVMLPLIRGGDKGWFKLKNVEMTADTITGTAAVNAINRPKVFIDRHTGLLSINGKAGHFTGQCEVFDANQPTRF